MLMPDVQQSRIGCRDLCGWLSNLLWLSSSITRPTRREVYRRSWRRAVPRNLDGLYRRNLTYSTPREDDVALSAQHLVSDVSRIARF